MPPMKRRTNACQSVLMALLISTGIACAQNAEQLKKMREGIDPVETERLAKEAQARYENDKKSADEWAKKTKFPRQGTTRAGNYFELHSVDPVSGPTYKMTSNSELADTVSTDNVQTNLGLTGDGFTIGHWGGGIVCAEHPEFEGRVTISDFITATTGFFPNNGSTHATEVAGTMIAAGLLDPVKGMAPKGLLNSFNWDNSEFELLQTAPDLLVSSQVWGYVTGWAFYNNAWYWAGTPQIHPTIDHHFGFYSDEVGFYDKVTFLRPFHSIVASVGNHRGAGPFQGVTQHYVWSPTAGDFVISGHPRELNGGADGFDSIWHGPAIAKNCITVGGAENIPGGYTSASDVVLTPGSAWGPTDDGRIKPDIVAADATAFTTSDLRTRCAYLNYGASTPGTSNATAVVSGSMLLLHEYYAETHFDELMRAATVKALIIHTADEAGEHPGPDYKHGWGLMNTERATQVIYEDCRAPRTIQELRVTDNRTKVVTFQYTGSTSPYVKVTIVWTDHKRPGLAAAVDPPDLHLINDLDLRVNDITNNITHFPWTLDPNNPSAAAVNNQDNNRDNVEQVIIENPNVDAIYKIGITPKSPLKHGYQDFSIIITGLDEVEFCDCEPIVAVTGPASPVCPGELTTLTAPDGWASYYWPQTGDHTQSTIVSGAGNYTVVVTDELNCEYSGNFEVTEYNVPDINLPADVNLCDDDEIPAFIPLAARLSEPGFTGVYAWTYTHLTEDGPGVVQYLGNTPAIQAAQPGQYTVTFTDDVTGCTVADTFNFNIHSIPTASIVDAPTSVCVGEEFCVEGNAIANVNGGGNIAAPGVSWFFPNGTPAFANDKKACTKFSEPGVHTVSFSVTNLCGTNTVSLDITAEPQPTFDIVADNTLLCPGDETNLTIRLHDNVGSSLTYSWSPTTGVDDPSSSHPTVSPTTTTTYTATVTNDAGCTWSESITVNVLPPPPMIATPVLVCVGETATVTVPSNGGSGFTYTWLDQEGNDVAKGISATLGAGTYTVVIDHQNGCQFTQTVEVIVNELCPKVKIVVGDADLCGPQTLTADVTGLLPPLTYQWTSPAWPVSLTNTIPTVDVTPAANTLYTVLVTDSVGTQVTTSIVLPALPYFGGVSITVPNVITPNGDGQNDVWNPYDPTSPTDYFYNASSYVAEVFDPDFGPPIWQSSGTASFPGGFTTNAILWDGTINNPLLPGNGVVAPDGTYVWVLHLETCEGTVKLEGTVFLND